MGLFLYIGLGTALAEGIDGGVTYTADAVNNLAGGVGHRLDTLGKLEVALDIDAEKAWHWLGTQFRFSYLLVHGSDPAEQVGDIQGVSNLAAPAAAKPFEAWMQNLLFGGKISTKVGMMDINGDFDHNDTAAVFLNASHGVGAEMSHTGIHGPSIYPYLSMGARLRYQPQPRYFAQVLLADGVPGSVANADERQYKIQGDDGVLVAIEAGFQEQRKPYSPPYSKFVVGAWGYSEPYTSLPSLDPATPGATTQMTNQGSYLLMEHTFQQEWPRGPKQGALFLRYGQTDGDLNPIDAYLGMGLVYRAPFNPDINEYFGLGIAVAHYSRHYHLLLRQQGIPAAEAETSIEFTYQRLYNRWLTLQPDLQYIVNPGVRRDVENSVVIALRGIFRL